MDRIVRINVTKVERTVRLNVVSNVTKIIVSQSSSGGGGGGVVTNLSLAASSENNTVSNTNGTGFVIGLATGVLAGLTLNNLTNALKTAYDNAVTWISANGTNTVNHLSNTSNPHSVTKSQVGLGNVDNTSDVDKPISNATQTALDTLENKITWVVVSSNQTALNDTNYANVANATYTDPSPTEGKGYVVKVVNGTATIGGVGYIEGAIVTRTFHSGSWRSKVYVDTTRIGTAVQTALNLKANKRVLMSLSSDRNLTATTALQAIFDTPIDVVAGEYIFSIETTMESLATSGNIQFGILGTAGVTSVNWISNGNKQAAFPTTNQIQAGNVTTAVQICGSSTGTNAVVKVDGRIVFSGSGTFIPAFLFSTSPTTGVVKSGSSISTIRVD